MSPRSNTASSHPAVDAVAIVPVADSVFGERICAVVTLRPGCQLSLAGLTAHLDRRGLGKESWPERLLVVQELPRSSGGKVAKDQVRTRVNAVLGTGPEPSP